MFLFQRLLCMLVLLTRLFAGLLLQFRLFFVVLPHVFLCVDLLKRVMAFELILISGVPRYFDGGFCCGYYKF